VQVPSLQIDNGPDSAENRIVSQSCLSTGWVSVSQTDCMLVHCTAELCRAVPCGAVCGCRPYLISLTPLHTANTDISRRCAVPVVACERGAPSVDWSAKHTHAGRVHVVCCDEWTLPFTHSCLVRLSVRLYNNRVPYLGLYFDRPPRSVIIVNENHTASPDDSASIYQTHKMSAFYAHPARAMMLQRRCFFFMLGFKNNYVKTGLNDFSSCSPEEIWLKWLPVYPTNATTLTLPCEKMWENG